MAMKKPEYSLMALFLTLVFFFPSASFAREKLAVMDLKGKYGVEEGLAEALSVLIRDTIHSFGDYEVLSKDDVEVIAERTAIRQNLGCDETQCLINIGRSLGTKFMVAGDISKLGNTYNFSLRLIDTMGKDPGVKKRVNKDCKCTEDELIDTARLIASLLLEKGERKPTSNYSKVSSASEAKREPIQKQPKGGSFPIQS